MHLGLFQDLGKQESEFMSTCNSKRSELQDEIIELGGRLTEDHECLNFFDSLDDLISASEGELDSVKKVNLFLPKAVVYCVLLLMQEELKIKAGSNSMS